MEVPGKGKIKSSDKFLKISGRQFQKQIEKEIDMFPIPANVAETSELRKEVGNNENSKICLENYTTVNDMNGTRLEDRIAEDRNTNSNMENVRTCTTGELGKCEELLEVMPQRINSANIKNAWSKNKNIKVANLDFGDCIAEDGCTIKLHKEKVSILNNSTWFVNGNIIGIEKWNKKFDPNSLEGLSAPIWIRMPNLPLFCWDEVNICRIASMVGKPYLIDGNMFQWSRREFGRVCVCIKLNDKLPTGVWVEGEEGKFYQKIEYERLPNLCFECGKIGHDKKECAKSIFLNKENSDLLKKDWSKNINEEDIEEVNQPTDDKIHNVESFGPWMMVNYGKKNVNNNWYRKPAVLDNKTSKSSQPKQYVAVKKQASSETTPETDSVIPVNNSFIVLEELEDGEINESSLNDNLGRIDTKNDAKGSPVIVVNKGEMNEKESVGMISNSIGNKEIDNSSQSSKKKKSKQLKDLGPINASTRSRRMDMEGKELNKLKEDLMEEILELQIKESSLGHLTDQDYWILKEKVLELNSTLARLNTWWKQRAKVNWLNEGDGNFRFFHNFASARRNINKIIKVKDEDGNMVEDQVLMEEVFMRFFQKKWEFRGSKMEGWPDPNICLNDQDRRLLEEDLTIDEVLHVLKQLEENTSPVDMEQAYDSMAWASLKGILDYFKFPPKFSKLIMECVVDPMFSIIINGNCSKWIHARSGFRQGCPLSTILFILCSQLLSNAFYHSSCGIKLCPEGPRISHLLYADDVIMFSKANKKEVLGVKRILHNFCEWTGQKINYSKSIILFGKNVERKRKRSLSRIMGFKYVKDFLYLGVKMALRRLKKEDFQFIIDKVLKKLNQWDSKCLSLSGKIILVKSILLALPIYHSTHSLVPKKLLADLDRICREFIWNKKNGIKGMHYVNWNDMCKPIEYGGRGLHSNIKIAPALRARLAWRFVQNQNSLLHFVMDAKYGNKLMNGNPNGNNSAAFKILNEGFNTLNPIVKWEIVNGKSVDAFKDTWILDKSINKWPTFVIPVDDNSIMVEDFISEGIWDAQNLRKFFGKDFIDIIMKTQIFKDKEADFLVLIKQNSGMTIPGLIKKAEASGLEVDLLWKWIKKAKLNSWVETFWWRLKRNAIPSMHFLCCRRIAKNANYPRGCDCNEDMEHIVCGCLKIKEIIQHLNHWGFGFPLFNSIEQCLRWMEINVSKKGMMVKLYCILVFLSWKSRNKRLHGGTEDNSSFIASEAIVQASVSNKYSFSNMGFWDVNQSLRLSNAWHPPPPNWIKVNVDASLISSYKAGIAAVFRDSKGRFLYAYGKSFIHWDIGQLELLAINSIKEEIKEWMFKYDGILIEGDNSNIISYFKKTRNKGKLKEDGGGLAELRALGDGMGELQASGGGSMKVMASSGRLEKLRASSGGLAKVRASSGGPAKVRASLVVLQKRGPQVVV
ncbi:hypothetical protein KFK09_023941 [Dendrobium nobile]|uniref:Uncharacterized protein n=1 Tax=Dendrobium nobile TaxID=94219 RepID=A0A8T3AB87_DENNO|nr:hypothetical protein KFK09_023941 [Dendrobium nobile]